jgi:hypothetical protein
MVLFEEVEELTFDCEFFLGSPITEIYWTLDPNDFPEPQYTKITWTPCDPNRPHAGVGANPKLKVTYEKSIVCI